MTVFIDSHLDTLLDQRRKRDLWDQGERVIRQNGYDKKIRYRSSDVYDKDYREPLPYDDRDIHLADPDDPESILRTPDPGRIYYDTNS